MENNNENLLLAQELKDFKLKSFKKPESTFIVIKNFIDPSACDYNELEKYFKRHPDDPPVFQTNKMNDNKRLQFLINDDNKLDNFKGLNEIDCKVENFIKNYLLTDKDEWFKKDCSVLLALEDCSKQELHIDYDDSEEIIDKTIHCFIILIALNNNTKLDAVKYRNDKNIDIISRPFRYEINLNSGDMLLARGTFLHGGSDYVEKNFRIHYYVNRKFYEPPHNATYLLTNKA
jgi:hypothetical protein